MAKEAREVWEKRIDRLRDSDLTDAEFAREIGVNVHTLRSWKWKLSGKTRGSGGAKRARRPEGKRTKRAAAKSATFVQMQVSTEADSARGERIELDVCGVAVRVPIGFDEPTLARVVSVLRQAS